MWKSLNHLCVRKQRWLSVPMRNEIGMYRSHRVSKPVISIRFSLQRVVIDRYLWHVKITQSPLGTFSQVAEYPEEERNRDVSKPPAIKIGDFDTIFTVRSCYKMLFLECENHSITFRNVFTGGWVSRWGTKSGCIEATGYQNRWFRYDFHLEE